MPDKSDRMDECAEAVGKARDFRQEIVAAAGLLPQTYISGTEKTDGNKAVPHSIASCGCIYPHCEGSSQLEEATTVKEALYLPSLRGEFTAYTCVYL